MLVKTNIKEASYEHDLENGLSVGCFPPGGGLKKARRRFP